MTRVDEKSKNPVSGREQDDKPGSAKRVDSRALMGERRELIIEHAGREYVLRVTQNGKLILTA